MTWITLSTNEVLLGFALISGIGGLATIAIKSYRNGTSQKNTLSWRRKSTWNQNRDLTLLFSLCIAILCCVVSFSWTTYGEQAQNTVQSAALEDDWTEVIPPTTHKKKPKPIPPIIEPTIIVPDKEDVIEIDEDIDMVEEDISETAIIDTVTSVGPSTELPKKQLPLPLPDEPKSDVREIVEIVEEMPLFPGCAHLNTRKERKQCSDEKLLSYVAEHLNYTPIAKENNIEGKVYIQFVIDQNGQLSQEKIRRDIGGGLGQEALKVIRGMKEMTWTPGKQQGRKVNVRMTLPVEFILH